jgi:hypothetical protein
MNSMYDPDFVMNSTMYGPILLWPLWMVGIAWRSLTHDGVRCALIFYCHFNS